MGTDFANFSCHHRNQARVNNLEVNGCYVPQCLIYREPYQDGKLTTTAFPDTDPENYAEVFTPI
jgi:hypothetical protein